MLELVRAAHAAGRADRALSAATELFDRAAALAPDNSARASLVRDAVGEVFDPSIAFSIALRFAGAAGAAGGAYALAKQ